MFRADHCTDKRGGILTYIKQNYAVELCAELADQSAGFQESMWLWVTYAKGVKCLVGTIYRKPNSSRANDESMISLLQAAANISRDILLVGDFNLPEIYWPDNTVKNKYNDGFNTPVEFTNVLLAGCLHQHVKTVTRARGRNLPSLLDLIITSWCDNVEQLEVTAPLGRSDHGIIQGHILFPFCMQKMECKETWNYKKADYTAARNMARTINWNQELAGKTPTEQYNQFVSLMKCIREATVPKKIVAKQPMESSKLWYNSTAKKLVNNKNKAWKRYMRAERLKLPDRLILQKKYIHARKLARNGIKKIKRQHEESLFHRLRDNPKSFYMYCNSKNKIRRPIGKITLPDGTPSQDDKEAACALNKHFKSIFTDEDDSLLIKGNDFFQQHFAGTDCPFPDCNHYAGPFLESVEIQDVEICTLLKKLKPHKSPGPDDIHPQLLSELAEVVAKPLKIIFRKSLETGQVPDYWKEANITAVHKKGPREDAKNYRPISLTCICSKVMETLIKNRILEHISAMGILNNSQHGFNRGRSCLTNLLMMTEECSSNLDKKIPTDIVYLDFAKAFDTVPHARLCHKLQHVAGIKGDLLRWIEDFLTDRRQQVVISGQTSGWEKVTSGVPQGSVIGPTLFLIYINDLTSHMSSSVQIFADDTKIYRGIQSAEDVQSLQQDLQRVERWSKTWKLCYNTSKCQVLRTGNKRDIANNQTYILNETPLENVKEQRDLGVIIDTSLEFDSQVNKCIKNAFTIWGIIKRTFEMPLCPKMFNLLFKTYIRPHLEYCPEVWSPSKIGMKKKIERVQRICTKYVKGLSNLSYKERMTQLGLTTLEKRRERSDMLEVHKIIGDLHSVNMSYMFQLNPNAGRRGSRTLFKPRHRTAKRGHFFSQRAINTWNKLLEEIKLARNSISFKNMYDKQMNMS